jgi:hypothetical protein
MNVHFEVQPEDPSVGIMAAGFSAWVSGSPTRWEPKVESEGWCEMLDYNVDFGSCQFQWWSSEGEIPRPKDSYLVERMLYLYAVEYYKVRG